MEMNKEGGIFGIPFYFVNLETKERKTLCRKFFFFSVQNAEIISSYENFLKNKNF
jgi:hypothetical protein